MTDQRFNQYSFAFISLKNLKHNLKIIRSLVKRDTKILIPVKSNAYGCGIIPVSKLLQREGIDHLGVAFFYEGVLLRKNKIKTPVLIFNDVIYKEDYNKIIKNNLTPTVYTVSSLKIYDNLGRRYNKKIKIHINVDTGMGRIGVAFKEIFDFINLSSSMNNIKLEGIYTHLSSADDKEKKFTLSQLKKFDRVIEFLKQKNLKIPYIHVLNSAGIMNYPEYCYNMVRPGIMFYGYYSDNKIRKKVILKPCMDMKAGIIFIKKVARDTPISYGHTYFTEKDKIIASVGAGYGDGINRLLSNNGTVLYRGKECPIRGRICMDQFMIDISSVSRPQAGDMVTIFGKDRKDHKRLEHIAEKLKTIPYEVLCLIGERVKRVYLE